VPGTADDEDCDDGTRLSNDCCSSTCKVESDGTPCDDGSECRGDVCRTGTCVQPDDCILAPPRHVKRIKLVCQGQRGTQCTARGVLATVPSSPAPRDGARAAADDVSPAAGFGPDAYAPSSLAARAKCPRVIGSVKVGDAVTKQVRKTIGRTGKATLVLRLNRVGRQLLGCAPASDGLGVNVLSSVRPRGSPTAPALLPFLVNVVRRGG
jgi:hypothetical protein